MRLIHICEACGLNKVMDSDEAYNEGWDYPPRLGEFGVVSPRTCGNCPINKTLWWRLAIDKVDLSALSEDELALIERIKNEPESILPQNGD